LHPFLDFSLRAICLFQRVSWISGVVLDPFWDPFWDVHLSMILAFLGSCFHPPEVPVFEVLFLLEVAVLKLPVSMKLGFRCDQWTRERDRFEG
jgi:hypothetical protein